MATRLNKQHRQDLIAFALKEATIDSSLKKQEDALKKQADKLIAAGLKLKFPAKDMAVLKKYRLTTEDDCIRVVIAEGSSDLVMYNFLDKKKVPPIPYSASCRYRNRAFWLGEAAAKAVREANKKTKEIKKAKEQLEIDFSSVVHSAKTFEELVKAWDPFKACAGIFNNGALLVLNEETVQRIGNYERNDAKE